MMVQGLLIHPVVSFRQITERVSHIPEETQRAFVEVDRFDIGIVAGMSAGRFSSMVVGQALGRDRCVNSVFGKTPQEPLIPLPRYERRKSQLSGTLRRSRLRHGQCDKHICSAAARGKSIICAGCL